MSKKIFTGILISKNTVCAGAVDEEGKTVIPLQCEEIDNVDFSPKKAVEHVGRLIKLVDSSLKKKRKKSEAVGISCPGSVSADGKTIHMSPCFGWMGFNFADKLAAKINIPVFIDNDVNIITLGEYWYGAGKGVQNMICVHVGFGIGCGIIINGRIYRGANNNAGEIGHMTLDMNGHMCECGNSGCFELYASNFAIINRAKRLLKFGGDSLLFELTGNDLKKLSHELIFKAALKGDNFALNIVEEACDYLGIGIANIVDILNPEMLVLSSSIPETGKYLFDSTIKIIRQRVHPVSSGCLKIEFSKLEENSAWPGIAKMVQEKL